MIYKHWSHTPTEKMEEYGDCWIYLYAGAGCGAAADADLIFIIQNVCR